MTESEWVRIAARIVRRWPGASLNDGVIAQWGRDLSDLAAADVAGALETLDRDGRDFAPNAGQIRRRVAELALDPPAWASVYRALERAARAGAPYPFANGQRVPDLRDGRLRDLAPPIVCEFVVEVGWPQVVTGLGPGNAEARLREKWTAYVEGRLRDHSYRGLPAPRGLRRLERVAREGGGLRRIGAGS